MSAASRLATDDPRVDDLLEPKILLTQELHVHLGHVHLTRVVP